MVELRRLLVAADGSEPAKNAALFAGDLASRFDGSVMAVAVVPKPTAAAAAWLDVQAYMPAVAMETDRIVTSAKRVSEEAALLAEGHGCTRAESTVELGDPAHMLVELADSYKAHAIVMGRRGTGNVSGLFLGSVSTKVSHLTECTVITVGTEIPRKVDRILVAVDGSEHSTRAAETARVLARGYDAELDILNIVPISKFAPFGVSEVEGLGLDRLADTLREYGEQIIDHAAQMGADLGLAATTAIAAGDPATRIAERADRTGADVICIGRRGLGNVAGLLLGSVSHSVAHGAAQTVVTVS